MNTLRLTLRQLQIFVAVARSGTTTAASAEIALSQSATSSAVNELERLLSLRLFDRAGKRLLLNDNGRALLPRALALLPHQSAHRHTTSSVMRAGRFWRPHRERPSAAHSPSCAGPVREC
jgi:DNA-binding transcriptional LysR family regulator